MAIQIGNGLRRYAELVGQEIKSFLCFQVDEFDTTELIRIAPGIKARQDNGLVALHTI